MINSEIKTLVNSLKLIGNPDGPGASAPDLSPVVLYVTYSPHKYEVNRTKTHEDRANQKRPFFYSGHCTILNQQQTDPQMNHRYLGTLMGDPHFAKTSLEICRTYLLYKPLPVL